jgi:hypothetical protein
MFCPVLLIGAEPRGADAGSSVGVADRVRRPGRAALDAVVAIRIIEAEEDGPPEPRLPGPINLPAGGTARARWAGLPRQSPARGAPDAAPQAPP